MIRALSALLLATTLSSCGIGRDPTDQHDMTALMRAARDGDHTAVTLALAGGAKVDQQVRDHSGFRVMMAFLAWMQSLPNRDGGYAALHYASGAGHREIASALVEAGARVDLVADGGQTALSLAAGRGDVPLARLLLEAGAPARRPPDLPPGRAWSPPLGGGASLEMARLLLGAGADPDEPPPALLEAAAVGDESLVRVLLDRGAAPDPPGHQGRTPLITAADAGHIAVVRLLLAAGADPQRRDDRVGWTAAQWAASAGHHEIVAALGGGEAAERDLATVDLVEAVQRGDVDGVRAALANGASPQARTRTGGPVLVWSVRGGNVEVTRALLDAGADLDVLGSGDIPHLHVAAQLGILPLVDVLLEAGADPRAPGTAVYAAGGGSVDVVRRLHEAGAPIHEDRDEPLRMAASGSRLDVMRFLLDQGAHVDAADEHGRTALSVAVARRRHDAVRILLDAGADPRRSAPESGWTPLMNAAMAGDSLMIRMLIDAGADPDARDREGKSAADYARGAGNGHVVPLLRRRQH